MALSDKVVAGLIINETPYEFFAKTLNGYKFFSLDRSTSANSSSDNYQLLIDSDTIKRYAGKNFNPETDVILHKHGHIAANSGIIQDVYPVANGVDEDGTTKYDIWCHTILNQVRYSGYGVECNISFWIKIE